MKRIIKKMIKKVLGFYNYEMVNSKQLVDFYLHDYGSYEEYKDTQVFHNKRKIDNIWADSDTLGKIATEIQCNFSNDGILSGLCHGTRNGFEQEYFNKNLNAEVIGTDISDTASNFENTVEWDFHDKRDDWVDKFDFIYTNSLDQSWNPKLALTTWLDQVHNNGIVFIEHTERHGPVGTSSMDPFGVKPRVMPYVLTKWFGNKISIKIIKSKKPNLNIPVWVFAVKRNY